MAAAAEQLGRDIVALCRGLGFALAGVADAAPTRWRKELTDWLAAGRHGSMAYLAEHVEARLDPMRVLPGARSVVMVADLYAARGAAPEEPMPRGRGRIARYARGRDYHTIMKKRLHRLCDALRGAHSGAGFRAFVDTAPVLEREYAARAGLGWIGKNTLLIHPRQGSFTLLGGVLTTLELTPPSEQEAVTDHCGTCTRCIDACPTGAISPYSVDATRCISYLTIERREMIDPAFHGAIGGWLYGCDVCQEVCPHNSPRPTGDVGEPHQDYRPVRDSFDLLGVLGWTEEDRRREFRGAALKRATLAMMKRNAIIVAGNQLRRTPNSTLRDRIAEIAGDEREPSMVRGAAAAVTQAGSANSDAR